MTIDTKRLASDPGYWDELKAPEDATHACIYSGGKWQWMRVNLSGPFNYYWHRRLSEWRRQESEVGEKIIPRPNKPAAPEWDGEGLPPSGVTCECLHLDSNNGKSWVECDVIGPYGDYVVCAPNGGGFFGFDAHELRPIRTPEQRQRDELIKIIKEADEMAYSFRPDDLADAILSKYNLTEK